jgi:methionyl-tRNA formyltransferase
MGASDLGYDCCEAILAAGFNVCGIVTLPQSFDIKYKEEKDKVKVNNVLYRDLHILSEKYSLPIIEIQENISSYKDRIAEMAPDFILVIGWYYMIPGSIMSLATKGVAGIHGSLLPKYRGNAPFVWAMINGEKETGVTFFYFEKGTDEGDIIAQSAFAIGENDMIADVLAKAKQASIDILLQHLPLIANNTAARIPQPSEGATYFPKRTPADGLIDWSWDKQRIKNFIRAQSKPYPGAFTIIDNKKIIIWDADILDEFSNS